MFKISSFLVWKRHFVDRDNIKRFLDKTGHEPQVLDVPGRIVACNALDFDAVQGLLSNMLFLLILVAY
jgi:hypothetical protein